jgi:hypothetical protein
VNRSELPTFPDTPSALQAIANDTAEVLEITRRLERRQSRSDVYSATALGVSVFAFLLAGYAWAIAAFGA